jgi:hypothetical protein
MSFPERLKELLDNPLLAMLLRCERRAANDVITGYLL